MARTPRRTASAGTLTMTAQVNHDGKLELPKAVMDRFGIKPGDRVELIKTAAGVLIRSRPGDMRDLKGIIPKPARAVTVAAMNRALSRMGR
jgi:antitoxin PrlF